MVSLNVVDSDDMQRWAKRLVSSCVNIAPAFTQPVVQAFLSIYVQGKYKGKYRGAADRSLGFEDEDLRSSPGLLGQ